MPRNVLGQPLCDDVCSERQGFVVQRCRPGIVAANQCPVPMGYVSNNGKILDFHCRRPRRFAPDYLGSGVDFSDEIGWIDGIVVGNLDTEAREFRIGEIAHRGYTESAMRMPSPALRNGSIAIALAAWPEGTRNVLAPFSRAVSFASSVLVVGVP